MGLRGAVAICDTCSLEEQKRILGKMLVMTKWLRFPKELSVLYTARAPCRERCEPNGPPSRPCRCLRGFQCRLGGSSGWGGRDNRCGRTVRQRNASRRKRRSECLGTHKNRYHLSNKALALNGLGGHREMRVEGIWWRGKYVSLLSFQKKWKPKAFWYFFIDK